MKTQMTAIAAAVTFAMSTAAFAQSAGSESTILQDGYKNTNNITQWGSQTSRVYQEGGFNSTTVSQRALLS